MSGFKGQNERPTGYVPEYKIGKKGMETKDLKPIPVKTEKQNNF